MRRSLFILFFACVVASSLKAAPDYIGDNPELIVMSHQDWGELGLNVAAHQPGIQGQPLQIGSKAFARGLGHHANGRVDLLLDGLYTAFEAEIGLQPCAGGSAIYRVLVDGESRYESPVIRPGEEPRRVHVDLDNASELSLEVLDAGDGIACDMANWADARLTAAANLRPRRSEAATVDIAPFGRIVTWDPERKNGAQAKRTQEFRAEDLFTETELKENTDRTFTIPLKAPEQTGCIGVQWLEQRHLRELRMNFLDPSQVPPTPNLRIEQWIGESAWQGDWKPAEGEFRTTNGLVTFTPHRKTPLHTRKIRWILSPLPAAAKVSLSAFSRSHWAETNIFVQCDKSGRGTGKVSVYNGKLKDPSQRSVTWDLRQPLKLSLLCSRAGLFSEPTLLRFELPSRNFSVSVNDVLANSCVYVPSAALFVSRDPAAAGEEHKRRIAGQRTILEQVRDMPEQTLKQAMEKTHRDYQKLGPVMLSLACDNSKFIVERDGTLKFHSVPFDWTRDYGTWMGSACQLRPVFGTETTDKVERQLEGRWLPIPAISTERGGVRYTQRTFVAPITAAAQGSLTPAKSLCIVEFTCSNTVAQPLTAHLGLKLSGNPQQSQPATFVSDGQRLVLRIQDHTVGVVEQVGSPAAQPTISAGELAFSFPLGGGEKSKVIVWLMSEGVSLGDVPDSGSVERLRAETGQYWTSLLARGTRVDTPDQWLNDVIRSSIVRCLIAARNEEHGQRIAASAAAMHYGALESESHSVIRGMDFFGQEEFAKRSLDYFIHRYNTNGFLTTGYTTFGTAWHLWSVGEHYALSKDKNWLAANAAEIARVCHWIIRQTEKTRRNGPNSKPLPESGLMPPGVLADWNAFAYHFTMNAYYAAALREAGTALATIRHPDSRLFLKESEQLRRNLLRAYAWTQERAPVLPLRDGTWIPYYPSQVHSPGKLAEFFPGQDAGRSWCYDVELGAHQLVPTGILPPQSREVDQMLNHMEDVQFLANGWFDYPASENQADWFNLGGFSKVQPYYTRNAEIYALRDDIKPFIRSYFNTLAAMISPEVLTIWEHFKDAGAFDKTHETGYFLHQTRTMLVQERANDLWLAPFIPSSWLAAGSMLSVSNAPTRFGNMGYQIASTSNHIDLQIDPPPQLPERIVLRLRHPDGLQIKTATLDGKVIRSFDARAGEVKLKPTQGRRMSARIEFSR